MKSYTLRPDIYTLISNFTLSGTKCQMCSRDHYCVGGNAREECTAGSIAPSGSSKVREEGINNDGHSINNDLNNLLTPLHGSFQGG
jgi:hypothetical protein